MHFDPKRFDDVVLQPNGIDTAFGVPDTNLSGLLTYFSAIKPVSKHIVTANEGGAVALAAGYYLSIGRVAMLIAAKEVFGIPMLLFVGWRGKSGEEELQDALVGPKMFGNLQANDIPYEEIPDCIHRTKDAVSRLLAKSVQEKRLVALVAPRDTFAEYKVDEPPKFPLMIRVSHPEIKEWISWAPTQLPLSLVKVLFAV